MKALATFQKDTMPATVELQLKTKADELKGV